MSISEAEGALRTEITMTEPKSEMPEFKISEEMAKLLDRFKPTPRQEIDWHLMMLGTEIGMIRGYIESVASAFEREFDAFDAKVAEEAAKLPEGMRAEFVEDRSDTAFNLTLHFPALTWQTTFVTIYSFLEHEMTAVARWVGKHLKIERSPTKGDFSVIVNVQRFLTDRCAIAFPASDAPWMEILQYTDLRNAIVHGRGQVCGAKNAAEVRKYVESKPTLTIEGADQVRVSKEFCEEVLHNVESLLKSLFNLVRDRVA